MREFIAKLGEWYVLHENLDPVRNRQILSFINGEDIADDDYERATLTQKRVELLRRSISTILAVS
jgi:hypothetical protein